MKTVHKSVLIWFSPQEMYTLVSDVRQYAAFLPWCDHAHILSEDTEGITAEIGISFGGIRQTFVTRNTHTPVSRVAITLVKGPFSKLEGVWNFHPLGDASQRACKVELLLHYGFDSPALATLGGPVFDKVASTLVDAFVKRAEAVYAHA